MPVDLAGARVSVPPGSVVSSGGCPEANAPVTLFLRGPHAGPNVYYCPLEPAGVTTVTFGLIAPGQATSGLRAVYVHGIRVFENDGAPGASGAVLVPSLGVQLDASGPLSSEVVSTLSRSPRAAALAGGRRPTAPAGWHRITFGGLGFAVPPNWTVHRAAFAGPLTCQVSAPSELPGLLSPPPSVALDAGTLAPAIACPNLPAPSAPGVGPQVIAQPAAPRPVSGPSDGLLVDPGPVGPLDPSASYGPCLVIHGLRACVDQDYPYGELVLRVERPDGRAVAVVIGLGGNGRVARTVLFSLRPA